MPEHRDQNFVHLHVHTEYSLLDGLSRIDKLVERARSLDMPALAITDHGTMFGVIDFYRACKDAGIKPVIGMEAYLARRSMHDRDPKLDKRPYHMLLLAQNETGYKNLMKIASDSQLEGYYYRPRIDRDYLAAHSAGLIATSGCLAAQIPTLITEGRDDEAKEQIGWYQDVFGKENFYLELQQHDIPELAALNKWLLDYSRTHHTNVPLLATNDVHYVSPDDYDPHDTLLCIQTGALKVEADRLRMSDASYHLTTPQEMWGFFGKEAPQALSNTLKVAEMCEVNLDSQGYHLPVFPVPEGFTATTYLRFLCEKGLPWRYSSRADDPAVRSRLDYELSIIHNMGFETYFLIVWDLCQFARQADIWFNVRGSGAGSVAAYALGITNIDPLENNLLFERFLNPGRVSMPDIDLDFPDDRREEMIYYTARKYGEDKVASIITFGTLGPKAAVRDIGRAMGVPLELVNQAARLIPTEPKPKPIKVYVDENPELRQLYETNTEIRQIVDTAERLQGVSRHASTHAAGVIIADKPLVEYIPLHRPTKIEKSAEGEGGGEAGENPLKAVTQFPMETCESIGLLKIDFLGLSTLTIMRKACDLIERHHGVQYTMQNIPYRPTGDAKLDQMLKETFGLFGRGDTIGVFQFESTGMQQMLRDMRPQRYEHIIAAVSLYRPGPMDFIPLYNKRLHGDEEPTYRHELLEPILAETYGICIGGDSLVFDARTGERFRVDQLKDRAGDFYIQGIDADYNPAVARVTHWLDNGTKSVYALTLQSGATIKATADHRFLTEQGWKPLSELKPGDFVATPSYLVEPDSPAEYDRRKLRRISREKFVPEFVFRLNNDDLAFFLASLWDCDGYVGEKICHYKTISERLALDIQTLLLRFGIPSVIHQSSYSSTRGDRNAYQVTVFDTVLLLEVLAPYMLTAKRDVEVQGYARATVSRDVFLQELHAATDLSNRQIMANYGVDRQHLNRMGRNRDRIAVNVVEETAEALALSATQQSSRVSWQEIKAIEPAGSEPVYDLTVEGIHNFVANNIIVHNCVYQEQIMQIAGQVFGYELGEADLMRKAVSKKKDKDLKLHRDIFLERGQQRGLDADTINKIFDDIEFFANYGFNRAHAADYAFVAVQTAFLKTHYPAEYMTAMLSTHHDESGKITTFLGECRRLGIPVLPPDVNESELDFDIQPMPDGKRGIRYGLIAIKNAGESALLPVVNARKEGGPFTALDDFCRRVDLRQVQKRALESLVKVGALDAFAPRWQMADPASLDRILNFSAEYHRAKEVGQMSMFGASSGMDDRLVLPDVTPVGDREMLNWEKELLGLYVSGRPADKIRDQLRHANTAEVAAFKNDPAPMSGKTVTVAGEVVSLRKIPTRQGQMMGVAHIEDWHDSAADIDVVLFPRTWDKFGELVKDGVVRFFAGKVDTSRGDVQIICDSVRENADVVIPEEQSFFASSAPPPDWAVDDSPYDDETGEMLPPPPAPEPDIVPVVAPATMGAAAVRTPALEPQLATSSAPASWMDDDTLPDFDPPPFDDQPQEVQRWLMIYFKRSDDPDKDRRRLRRLHGILTGYPGKDRFSIVVEDRRQSFKMEFPNNTTAYCDDLVRDLEGLVGQDNLQIFQRPD